MNPDNTTQKYPNCIFPHDGEYEVFIYPAEKEEWKARIEKDLSGQDHKIQSLSIGLFPNFFNETWSLREVNDHYNNERLFSEEIENALLQDWIITERSVGILNVKKGKACGLTVSFQLYEKFMDSLLESKSTYVYEKKYGKTHRFEIYLKTNFDGSTCTKFYLEGVQITYPSLHRTVTNQILKHFFDMEEQACKLGYKDKKIKAIVIREDTKQDSQEKNAGIIDTLKKKLFDP